MSFVGHLAVAAAFGYVAAVFATWCMYGLGVFSIVLSVVIGRLSPRPASTFLVCLAAFGLVSLRIQLPVAEFRGGLYMPVAGNFIAESEDALLLCARPSVTTSFHGASIGEQGARFGGRLWLTLHVTDASEESQPDIPLAVRCSPSSLLPWIEAMPRTSFMSTRKALRTAMLLSPGLNISSRLAIFPELMLALAFFVWAFDAQERNMDYFK